MHRHTLVAHSARLCRCSQALRSLAPKHPLKSVCVDGCSAKCRSNFDGQMTGFAPEPGERPLWFVEKFEARRKALMASQQGEESETAGTSKRETEGGDPQANADAGFAGKKSPWQQLLRLPLQLMQLTFAVWLLILWPASVMPGGLELPRVWLLFAGYWLFFAVGSVHRILRYGQLASRKVDRQNSSWSNRIAWLVFVCALPVLHWLPLYRFVKMQRVPLLAGYDVLGFFGIVAAIVLNYWAAKFLGESYNRVVTPKSLVTAGPYKYMQHPVYTSYMLLFCSYCLALHSAPAAIAIVLVCLGYYSTRTRPEAEVLRSAFGEEYEAYQKATKRFVPGLY